MKRGIIIDLTALLDVIMILMFLVLVYTSQRVQNIQAQYVSDGELTQKLAASQSANIVLQRRINTFIAFEKNCGMITLSVKNADNSVRTILLENGDDTPASILLTWDNPQYAKNLLASALVQKVKDAFVNEKQAVFMIFQYDRNKIYQSDYALIKTCIRAQTGRDDVYCAEYDISEDFFENE
jgi:hypothetical protein